MYNVYGIGSVYNVYGIGSVYNVYGIGSLVQCVRDRFTCTMCMG